MKTRIVTKRTALKLLKRAVDEKGEDYVYPKGEPGFAYDEYDMCVYFTLDNEHAPACIVGHVLDSVGVKYKDLYHQEFPAEMLNDKQNKVFFTDAALQVLKYAQRVQDNSRPWGVVLEHLE